MSTPGTTGGVSLLRNPSDFSVVLGGPFFRCLRRAHLSDDSLSLLRRRIAAIALLAWLPLLLLSAVEGHLFGGTTVPFVEDVDVHAKLLLVVPLLLIAELVLHRRIRPLLHEFSRRNLIPENATPRFDAAIASALRRKGLRDYGTLAEKYVRDFDTKWMRGGAPPDEPLVGSADIQSLADMANSYEVVRTMRIAPITRQAVLGLVVATLLPIAPLVLTIMPLEALLKKLMSLVF